MYRIWFPRPQELPKLSSLSHISPHEIYKDNNCKISWKALSVSFEGIQDVEKP